MASRPFNPNINSLNVNHSHDAMTLGITPLSVATKNPVLTLMAPSIKNLNAECFILSIVMLSVVAPLSLLSKESRAHRGDFCQPLSMASVPKIYLLQSLVFNRCLYTIQKY
jgi:hypothetical protein